jgi:nucleotide-binding universal stress UspA family protein
MFKNILVAVDGSEYSDRAFEISIDLAQKYGSRLFIVHVAHQSMSSGAKVTAHIDEAFLDLGRKIVDSYGRKAEERNVQNVSTILKKGDAAQKIIETVQAENCELVVIGSRGKGAFKELLLGSVSHKVTNHVKCPVLVVR